MPLIHMMQALDLHSACLHSEVQRVKGKLLRQPDRNVCTADVFVYVCMYMYMCVRNWPLPIGACEDQYKQTMINEYSNKHNWQEADQWAIYKRSREVTLGATENNIS